MSEFATVVILHRHRAPSLNHTTDNPSLTPILGQSKSTEPNSEEKLHQGMCMVEQNREQREQREQRP
jgi:hypothetical protein